MKWYTAPADDADGELTRLVAAWPDAPVLNLEVLGMLLEIARDDVLAYAPTPATEEGEVIPGTVTVHRRNLATNPSGFVRPLSMEGGGAGITEVSRERSLFGPSSTKFIRGGTGARGVSITSAVTGFNDFSVKVGKTYAVSWSVFSELGPTPVFQVMNQSYNGQGLRVLSARVNGIGAGVWERMHAIVRIESDATAKLRVYSTSDTQTVYFVDGVLVEEAATVGEYFDGSTPPIAVGEVTYSHAWDGAEHASTAVETYRPSVFVPAHPTRYVFAQLMQAKNLWNAGTANTEGEMGEGGFVFVPRPMDKTIKRLIVPIDMTPDVH